MSRIPILLLVTLSISRLLAHDPATPKPKILQRDIPVHELAGLPGHSQVFEIVLPEGVAGFTLTTAGGKGDCDLYVRHGSHPTDEHFDAASKHPGTAEQIAIEAPEPGRWYLLVDAFEPFHGVRLKAHYDLLPGTLPVPTLLPAPGVFAREATVRVKCANKDAELRYTTDDSPVTATSPLYEGPLKFSADTHLRVKAFGPDGAESAEGAGDYLVALGKAITRLESGQAIFHRAGAAGSRHTFVITIPPGQKSLSIRTESGPGDTELLYRHATAPTPLQSDGRVNGRGNRAVAEIAFPAAGDWFIQLRGLTEYSGVSMLASVRPDLPDLIVWRDAIVPYIDEADFDEEDCEVQEGTIEAGHHTLLRFDTETRNIGASDLVMPSPVNNPDFEYQECHGHYHFKGFAAYRLLDAEGHPVVLGRKVSFCLLDVRRWDAKSKRNPRFDCSMQGIQSGWADIYDGGLPGQWLDVTGIPDGAYTLEVKLNPDGKLIEANTLNNSEQVPIVLSSPPPGRRAVQVREQR